MAADQASSLKEAAQSLVEGRLLAGAAVRFHVSTTSMLPTLQPGDALMVEGGSAARAEPGALVVIRNDNTWLVHRLILCKTGGERLHLLTKGDNRLLADPGVDGTGPVGVVKRIQRGEKSIDLDTRQVKYGGHLVAWLSGQQAALMASEPGPVRRLLIKGLQKGIYLLASQVYKI